MSFFDLEAEKQALAYSLTSAEALAESQQSLQQDYFEDLRHQRIWDAIKFYFQQFGGMLDRGGLQTLLTKNETPEDRQVVYLGLLDDIRARIVTKDQFKVALSTLIDMRFKRGLYDLTNGLAANLQKGNLDATKVCNDIITSVISLQSAGQSPIREMSYLMAAKNRIDEYTDRKNNPQKYMGLPYGIKKIDELTAGVQKGELSIIFARPGVGKSTLLHNVAYTNAKLGKTTLYVSIEMPKEQIGRRLDSRHLQISARGLRGGNLNREEEAKFEKLPSTLGGLTGDIIIVDMPQGCSPSQLLPILRKHRLRQNIDLLLIDYLNLMDPSRWSNSKVERTSDVSRELKQLARLEQIPVITPARATRGVVDVKQDDIGSEHLSWSDAIGYDADQIIYLQKDKTLDSLSGTLKALLVKFRDGSNETVEIGADFDRSYLGDLQSLLEEMQAKPAGSLNL